MGPHVVSIVMNPAKTLKAHLDSHAGPEGDPDFPEESLVRQLGGEAALGPTSRGSSPSPLEVICPTSTSQAVPTHPKPGDRRKGSLLTQAVLRPGAGFISRFSLHLKRSTVPINLHPNFVCRRDEKPQL